MIKTQIMGVELPGLGPLLALSTAQGREGRLDLKDQGVGGGLSRGTGQKLGRRGAAQKLLLRIDRGWLG